MFFTFIIVVILTAVALVVAAMTIAHLIAPRSFNPQKGEPYDLFAILFLMFDIETVFLFPWAVVAASAGTYALVSAACFLGILILGLAYAWRKGALEWN